MKRLTAAGMHELVAGAVRAAVGRAWLTVAVCLALTAAAGLYAATHFKMSTDTAALISPALDWRRNSAAFDRAFPQQADTVIVVIDGRTPEQAEAAARALLPALQARPHLFPAVTRPDGGPFFDQNGLLLLPTAEVQASMQQLIAAQPFLGPLAADPSLRGVLTAMDTLLTGVEGGQAQLAQAQRPFRALATTFEDVAAGRPASFSWQALFAGEGAAPSTRLTRKFLIVKPVLDYSALEPGSDASEAIRAEAARLNLTPANGVTVRLTGPVPLSDEEFASLSENILLVTALMIAAVLVMLWLAVRSVRITAAILLTTVAGLVITAGLGLLTVGRFNLISVAFIPLFVGLGVDFGIQFSVRYREERRLGDALAPALIGAGAKVGGSLALAATAIAVGFFAFLPTSYVGVSELGLIAGGGMIAAFLLSITLLPALLVLLRPRAEGREVGLKMLAPLDEFIIRRRRLVLGVSAGLAALCAATLPLLHFDFNPLHLRSPRVESMSTLSDLMSDPDRNPNTIDVLAPSLAEADALARRLSALPEVGQAVTLSSFVPGDQQAKLLLVQDAALLLDFTLNPPETAPPPTYAETLEVMRRLAARLRAVAGPRAGQPGAADAQALAASLDRLVAATPPVRAKAAAAVTAPLAVLLDQTRAALAAQPVTLDSLPPDLRAAWVAPDGRARIQVFPANGARDNASLVRFARAVRAVAPNASGTAISIQAAGKTISDAFLQAGVLSLIAISALLFLVLRRVHDVVVTLLPIILTGLLTLATCVVIGLPLNFANIIALPLLFGVGVAFHCYLTVAWRAGETHFLQSALARGVIFSALTTGVAFGALWLSSHPGTASMGQLLLISLAWTLCTALLFGPALMGPPPQESHTSGV